LKKKESEELKVDKVPVARKEQVAQYFDGMKRTLQIKRVNDYYTYLFDTPAAQREETSVEDLATILYTKFLIPKNDAFLLSRYLIEKPKVGSTLIEFDPKRKELNRKIVKALSE